jgi:hypothetical protein
MARVGWGGAGFAAGFGAAAGAPSAAAISAAEPQRASFANSIARRMALSVSGRREGLMLRGGARILGSAVRSVAVAGACPVSAW